MKVFVFGWLAMIYSLTSGQPNWDEVVVNPDGDSEGITRNFDVCIPIFTNQQGVGSSQAGTVLKSATLSWCTINCQNSALCVGFDYNSATSHCSLLKAADFNTNGQVSQDVAQYTKINDCAYVCHPSWSTNQGQAATSGGLPIRPRVIKAGNKTALTDNKPGLTGCLEFCARRTPSCVGIEYTPNSDPNGVACKYFPTSMGTAQPAAQTTQYIMTNPCAEVCNVTWPEYQGQTFGDLTAGAQTRNSTISTTADECYQECILDPSCVIYIYSITGPFYCTMSNGYNFNKPIENAAVNSVIFDETCP